MKSKCELCTKDPAFQYAIKEGKHVHPIPATDKNLAGFFIETL